MNKATEAAVFGGGCFWCTEAIFSSLKGVMRVTPGYAGGRTTRPTYQQVCAGTTGHAEVIKVEYDPIVIGFSDLLEVFFHTHDPTTANRQGNDIGEQYRSIILYQNESQKELAEQFIEKLNIAKEFEHPVVTQIRPLTEFYQAEEHHQGYYLSNAGQPYCQMVIAPKLAKLRAKSDDSLKSS